MGRGRGWAGLASVVLLAVSCSGPSPNPSPSPSTSGTGGPPEIDRLTPLPSPLPDIVARVNGQPVQLNLVLALSRKALILSKDKEKDKAGAVRQAMHQYIIRELLFQEALARGMVADPQRLQQAYDKARLDYRDEARWASKLADQGMDPQSFKSELRVQETVNTLVTQEAAKVPPVSDDEAQAFFNLHPDSFGRPERLRLRHILVGVLPTATDAQRKEQRLRADGLYKRAAGGEDFIRLAQQYSDDYEGREKGGLIAEFKKGEAAAAFEEAAFALKPGQLSAVVEVPSGYEIIKLEEKLPAEPAFFAKDKEAIKLQMLHQRRGAALQALVNSLRAKARIETYI